MLGYTLCVAGTEESVTAFDEDLSEEFARLLETVLERHAVIAVPYDDEDEGDDWLD